MSLTLRARVVGGRLLLDEPVELPDGTVVDLVPADDADGLDESDRARLHQALELAARQLAAGDGIPAADALRRLRPSGRR